MNAKLTYMILARTVQRLADAPKLHYPLFRPQSMSVKDFQASREEAVRRKALRDFILVDGLGGLLQDPVFACCMARAFQAPSTASVMSRMLASGEATISLLMDLVDDRENFMREMRRYGECHIYGKDDDWHLAEKKASKRRMQA